MKSKWNWELDDRDQQVPVFTLKGPETLLCRQWIVRTRTPGATGYERAVVQYSNEMLAELETVLSTPHILIRKEYREKVKALIQAAKGLKCN